MYQVTATLPDLEVVAGCSWTFMAIHITSSSLNLFLAAFSGGASFTDRISLWVLLHHRIRASSDVYPTGEAESLSPCLYREGIDPEGQALSKLLLTALKDSRMRHQGRSCRISVRRKGQLSPNRCTDPLLNKQGGRSKNPVTRNRRSGRGRDSTEGRQNEPMASPESHDARMSVEHGTSLQHQSTVMTAHRTADISTMALET
ncbi:hypothetical protein V8C44DRAFT_186544 [Trichoderma aethiopicum]